MSERTSRRDVERQAGKKSRNVATFVVIVSILVCLGCAGVCYWSMMEIMRANEANNEELKTKIDEGLASLKEENEKNMRELAVQVKAVENRVEENTTTVKNNFDRLNKTFEENRREMVDLTHKNQSDLKKLSMENNSKVLKEFLKMKAELSSLVQRLIDLYT